MPSGIMFKWQLLGMVEYDAILLADLDVDMMPLENDPARVAARWRDALPLFLSDRIRVDGREPPEAGVHVIANSDHASPINTGSMILKPSGFLYRSGLRALERCELNKTHGWDLIGRPRRIIAGTSGGTAQGRDALWIPRYFSVSAGGLTTQLPAKDPRLLADEKRPRGQPRFFQDRWHARPYFQVLNNTEAFKRDDFGFVAGGEDQGFFWYMLFLKHGVGALSHPDDYAHRINHYWGTVAGSKAWEGRLWAQNHGVSPRLGMNLHYLSRIEPSATGQYSPCRTSLMLLRRSAEQHPEASRSTYSPPTLPLW
jgi:hypothetical protein